MWLTNLELKKEKWIYWRIIIDVFHLGAAIFKGSTLKKRVNTDTDDKRCEGHFSSKSKFDQGNHRIQRSLQFIIDVLGFSLKPLSTT